MRVIYADPGKALRMEGSLGPLQSEALTGTLTVTLNRGGAGTRIVMEYVVGGYMRYKTDEIAPAVDKVLAEQIAGLAASLGATAGAAAADVTSDPAPAAKPARFKTKPKSAAKP